MKISRFFRNLGVLVLLSCGVSIQAQTPDLAAGQTAFSACAGCHGGGPSDTRPYPLKAGSLVFFNTSHGTFYTAAANYTNLAFFLASKDTATYSASGTVTNARKRSTSAR